MLLADALMAALIAFAIVVLLWSSAGVSMQVLVDELRFAGAARAALSAVDEALRTCAPEGLAHCTTYDVGNRSQRILWSRKLSATAPALASGVQGVHIVRLHEATQLRGLCIKRLALLRRLVVIVAACT